MVGILIPIGPNHKNPFASQKLFENGCENGPKRSHNVLIPQVSLFEGAPTSLEWRFELSCS